jgi:hypothetical protein
MWNAERMREERRAAREGRQREVAARAAAARKEAHQVPLVREEVRSLYTRGLSMAEIGRHLGCSVHKVAYWMERYGFVRRSRSDALYTKCNPSGDPFRIIPTVTRQDAFIAGLGLGLYWGEGTRANHTSVRLGNADPRLIRAFIAFLVRRYGARPERFTFGLQVFSDTPPAKAKRYWCAALHVPARQFQKVVVTPSRGIGTYRRRLANGVLTVYFHNRKLRDILVRELERVSF